jgi:hypothetical protein
MPNEFCPHCKTLRNMSVSTIKKKAKRKKGKAKEVFFHSYHCEDCGSFIRSEENDTRIGHIASLYPLN